MTTAHQRLAERSTQPRRVTWRDLDADPALLTALVDAYRTVFGGAEWREWSRCTHPDCLRQYSKDESLQLAVCACGRAGTLVPFHPEHEVIRRLRRHLADPVQSACYLWADRPDSVGAFCWGYRTSVSELAEEFATDDDSAADISAHIAEHLGRHPGDAAPDPARTRVCRFAEGGVTLPLRNTGLTWAMFDRLLAWADETRTSAVVARTSGRSPMYRICGERLGMRIVYHYRHAADDRVILAGTAAEMRRRLESRPTR